MAPHSEIIASHFESVSDYTYVADKVVPFNKELHDQVLSELSIWAHGEFRILDLGSGPGEVLEKILLKFPKCHAVGIDMSDKMIAKAKKRLAKFGERAAIEKGDFDFADFGFEYDFITSEVAIHNSTDEEKKRLFRRIFESLSDAGIFINGDFIAGEDPKEDEKDKQWYLNFLRMNLKGDELEAWVRHAFYEDNPAKLSDQLAWLKEAGFKKVECPWKKMNLAVYVAYK